MKDPNCQQSPVSFRASAVTIQVERNSRFKVVVALSGG